MKRRDFIKSSALTTGAISLPFSVLSQDNKINLAILGTGWWGRDFLLKPIMSSGFFNITALCDVNERALEQSVKKILENGFPEPQLFFDYRQMYNMEGLEAVVIATPTHWHALQFIDACERGLHVFLEKPISYDIREGQAMLAAHGKVGNIVQVDFPRMMVDTNAQVKQYIESGEAGEIYQVQANIYHKDNNLVEKEIPATLDFETFCGPAPKVKYLCSKKWGGFRWRDIHELSRGIMVDWGIHYLHNARQVLSLGLPDRITAQGGNTRLFTHTNPDYLEVNYMFDGLPVTWSHKNWGFVSPVPKYNYGVFYLGEKATIFAGDVGWEVMPAGATEVIPHGDVSFNPKKHQETFDQMMLDLFTEFANGVRTKSEKGITNTFFEAYKTTSMVNYGDIAFRSDSTIEIDKTSMDITNSETASAMLKREYRAPYEHPYV